MHQLDCSRNQGVNAASTDVKSAFIEPWLMMYKLLSEVFERALAGVVKLRFEWTGQDEVCSKERQ